MRAPPVCRPPASPHGFGSPRPSPAPFPTTPAYAREDQAHWKQVHALLGSVDGQNAVAVAEDLRRLQVVRDPRDLQALGLLVLEQVVLHQNAAALVQCCVHLYPRLPEFDHAIPNSKYTFPYALRTCCQHEFSRLLPVAAGPLDPDAYRRLFGCTMLVGQLYLNQLASPHVIQQMLNDLLFCPEPRDEFVVCSAELWRSVGAALNADASFTPHMDPATGKVGWSCVADRLVELDAASANGNFRYPTHIRSTIHRALTQVRGTASRPPPWPSPGWLARALPDGAHVPAGDTWPPRTASSPVREGRDRVARMGAPEVRGLPSDPWVRTSGPPATCADRPDLDRTVSS